MIRGVVFDIDDTLYDERDYVHSGFVAVGRAAGRSGAEATALASWLWAAFESGVRGDTFDRLRAAFPEIAARWTTIELVEIYRTHSPEIGLVAGMPEVLDALRRAGVRLGVLSDGPVASQAAKASALDLERWFDPIILTGRLGPEFHKPGSAGFETIADGWGLPGTELAYVADNPVKDFVAPRRLGWLTIRLSHPRQLRHELEPEDEEHRPDVVVDTPRDLRHVLSRVDRSLRLA